MQQAPNLIFAGIMAKANAPVNKIAMIKYISYEKADKISAKSLNKHPKCMFKLEKAVGRLKNSSSLNPKNKINESRPKHMEKKK